jgi:hypothetical protein
VASAWGSSWGTSWASSWGAADIVSAPATVGTVGGSYPKRELDKAFKEYLAKKERKRQREQEPKVQPAAASIAALVEANAQSPVLSDRLISEPISLKANDDEEAIMVLLLAA